MLLYERIGEESLRKQDSMLGICVMQFPGLSPKLGDP